MSGRIHSYEKKDNGIVINFMGQRGDIQFITPTIVNIFAPISSERKPSWAVEDEKGNRNISFQISERDDEIILESEELKLVVSASFKVDIYNREGKLICADYRGERRPFPRRGNLAKIEEEGHTTVRHWGKHRIEVLKQLSGGEYIYGLGETTGHLNKKGYRYIMWNTDYPAPHIESLESLYKSIPFFIVLKDKLAYGLFFDNTYKAYFDLGKECSDYLYYGVDNGNLNYYFIYGPTIKEVIEKYTYLTGRTPLPPLWSLGYHQSRYSYESEERVREIARKFRERDIPCDVIYLDIDYMDGYRVFTWDKERFPAPKKMIYDLKKEGFKVVTILDPGVKKERGYPVYDEGLDNDYFITDKDGIPYVNRVWPGLSVFPDFSCTEVREWWAGWQNKLLEIGVSGIWNDMNEPASFEGPIPDDVRFWNDGNPTVHAEMHNVYGHLMARASAEGIKKNTGKRPFVITRACYAGSQKYSS
ncbi:MAG: TIM-barrel domain-containing protein, partial [Halanaerobiales bacterium]